MTEGRKRPKIRLIPVGEGLKEIISEIENLCAEWGYEIFTDIRAGAPHYEAIIMLLKDREGKIGISATIGETTIDGEIENLERFIEQLMNQLFSQVVESQKEKNRFEEELDRLFLYLFDSGEIKTKGPFTFKLHEKNPDAPRAPIYIGLRPPPKGSLTKELIKKIG